MPKQTRPPVSSANLISPEEVAKLLNFSRRTIIRMAQRGELPGAVFIGSHVRFKPQEIARFIERGGSDRTANA